MAYKTKKTEAEKRPFLTHVFVRLKGISPLLLNPIQAGLLEKLAMGAKVSKEVGSPEELAKKRVLLTEEGSFYVPRDFVFSSWRLAGQEVKYGKVFITSLHYGTKLPFLVRIHGERFILHNGEGGPVLWQVDTRRGANKLGQALALCRPRFDQWGTDLNITVRTDRIELKKIYELIEVAGAQYGFGSFRPGSGGEFGMYEVVTFKVTGREEIPERPIIEEVPLLVETRG